MRKLLGYLLAVILAVLYIDMAIASAPCGGNATCYNPIFALSANSSGSGVTPQLVYTSSSSGKGAKVQAVILANSNIESFAPRILMYIQHPSGSPLLFLVSGVPNGTVGNGNFASIDLLQHSNSSSDNAVVDPGWIVDENTQRYFVLSPGDSLYIGTDNPLGNSNQSCTGTDFPTATCTYTIAPLIQQY